MTKAAKQTEASTPTASPVITARPPETGKADADRKQPEALPAPLAWLTDATSQAWRAWSQMSPFAPENHAARASRSASARHSQPAVAVIRDSVASPASIDRLLHAGTGRFTLGLSPAALWLAYADWAIHLWASPGKRQQLVEKGARQTIRFLTYLSHLAAEPTSPPCVEPLPQDHRFRSAAWQQPPFNLIYQAFVSFVLTSGGHNAGIVSEPGHPGRHYRMSQHAAGSRYIDPETWYAATKAEEGSWWPAWLSWLERQSHGRAAPPALGAPERGYPPLEAAPGRYVLEH